MRKRARIIFTIVHLGTTDGKVTVATSSERGNDALRSKVISEEKGREGEENNKQTTNHDEEIQNDGQLRSSHETILCRTRIIAPFSAGSPNSNSQSVATSLRGSVASRSLPRRPLSPLCPGPR